MDRYCVIGNPIDHSLSPQIHQEFALQTGELLTYEKVQVELTGFAEFLKDFVHSGGSGLNITVPFKVEAFNGATQLHELANIANAVNTLSIEGEDIIGFNTDGLGFIRDLTQRHGFDLTGKSVLILGAGGACRGIIEPLLSTNPAQVTIANRTLANAQALCDLFSGRQRHDSLRCVDLSVLAESDAGTYDLVVNSTSLGLSADGVDLPASLAKGSFCYDMSYGDKAAFAGWAKEQGALHSVDGLGMLVEQAAESFNIWRGVMPRTEKIYQSLKKQVGAQV
jgi:shikimate dehydrogenase|tara:strand:- start:991 stop:1830 length:840 start_codon:yes stop_codon:yes gene_type:complete